MERKEGKITLKSKPLNVDASSSRQHLKRVQQRKLKPRNKQHKGTRGPTWIG